MDYIQPNSCVGSMTCWWCMMGDVVRKSSCFHTSPVEFLSSVDSLLYLQRLFLNLSSLHPLKAECPPGCKSGLENVGLSLFLLLLFFIENAVVVMFFVYCFKFFTDK